MLRNRWNNLERNYIQCSSPYPIIPIATRAIILYLIHRWNPHGNFIVNPIFFKRLEIELPNFIFSCYITHNLPLSHSPTALPFTFILFICVLCIQMKHIYEHHLTIHGFNFLHIFYVIVMQNNASWKSLHLSMFFDNRIIMYKGLKLYMKK